MASASTQKTDPVMEPKLKAVDWEKVEGAGQGRVAPRLEGPRGGGAEPPAWLLVMRGDEDPGAGAGSSRA